MFFVLVYMFNHHETLVTSAVDCVGVCVQSDMRRRGKLLGQGEVEAQMSSISRKLAY